MIDSPSVGSQQTEMTCTVGAGAISMSVSLDNHPMEAVYTTAYHFIDRCYVLIEPENEGAISVTLRSPDSSGDEDLLALGQEFVGKMVSDTVRSKVEQSTRTIREYYTAHAFYFGDAAPADIDALLAELDAEDAASEGESAGVPWDETESEEAP